MLVLIVLLNNLTIVLESLIVKLPTKDGESHEVMIYWYVNGTKFIPKDKTKPYIFQTHADSLEINPFVADLEKVISDVFPNAEFKLTGYKLISNEKYAGLPTPLASLIDLQ
jgi:hypothetical protein